MAQVTLRINGYAYTLGCRDGEEQHLQAMASEVERRIDSVRAAAGQSGESRMLVMASLMMADDIFEMQNRLAQAEADVRAATRTVTEEVKPDPKLARKLNRMAKRAEDIAEGLESP
jgi:cell division protein ZapA